LRINRNREIALAVQINKPQSVDDLLTEKQARAEELPLSLAWYRRRRLAGGGPPFIRIANRVFYRRGTIRAWIESQSHVDAAEHR
jgi:hypothetical protein